MAKDNNQQHNDIPNDLVNNKHDHLLEETQYLNNPQEHTRQANLRQIRNVRYCEDV